MPRAHSGVTKTKREREASVFGLADLSSFMFPLTRVRVCVCVCCRVFVCVFWFVSVCMIIRVYVRLLTIATPYLAVHIGLYRYGYV